MQVILQNITFLCQQASKEFLLLSKACLKDNDKVHKTKM